MIADAFRAVHAENDCLLLAAGVSNSSEKALSEFQREKDVVVKAIVRHPESRVIYFSTCSVYGTARSPYVEHKLRMEQVVTANAKSFLILRLPQVVGLTSNSTLVSFFVEQILKRNTLRIQAGATRNLIDVCDVVRITSVLLDAVNCSRLTVNIAAKRAVSARDIIQRISDILEVRPHCVEVRGGEAYPISVEFIEGLLRPDDPIFGDKYWVDTLDKYVPLLAKRTPPR